MNSSKNKIELESFSWCIYENNVAKKTIDKTCINEYSTGVPMNIVRFFTNEVLKNGERLKLKLSLNGLLIHAYLERKKDGRHRLNFKEVKQVIELSMSDINNSIWFEKNEEDTNAFHLFIDIKDSKIHEVKGTYRISSVKTRIGQYVFKAKLIDKWKNRCSVTGVKEHTPSILIASHMKPWAKCNDRERLDENNGLLLSPHIDKLFDTHRITFSTNSELVIADCIDDDLIKVWNINKNIKLRLSNKQQYYMEHHRKIFNSIN